MDKHSPLRLSLAVLAAGAVLSAASLAQAAEAAIAARAAQPDGIVRAPSAYDGLIAPASLNQVQARASLAVLVRATIKPAKSALPAPAKPAVPLRNIKPPV